MVIAADYPFLDILGTMLVFFGFVVWFWLLIRVFGDVFRRDDIGGWAKFFWSVFVIVGPVPGRVPGSQHRPGRRVPAGATRAPPGHR